ncbi:hypothetical protein MTR67_012354 [Solanum verrucosum]|uniref:Uncharacterized protein n=1 Tax=Solanum verrucosum TaxID=315347 RepID=A0AAF0THF6_SOLVR|nr:hypothetical protein MTR67_012354 [Solanum verrucosum]
MVMASIMASYEIDFAWFLVEDIHERAFCDRLTKVAWNQDVGLIKDYKNLAAQRHTLQPDVKFLDLFARPAVKQSVYGVVIEGDLATLN